jgi:hypothetical protein
MLSQNSSRPFSRKIGIVLSRYNMPLTWRLESGSQMTSPPQLVFFLYVQTTYSWLRRILAKDNIESAGLLEDLQVPLSGEEQPGTEDTRGIPSECGQVSVGHDCQSVRDQNKRAPLTHMAWTSRHIASGRT